MFIYILILVLLLFLSFSFSGFETAITSLTKLEVKNMILQPKYRRFQSWLDNPSEYLIALLVGNSLVNILFSMILTAIFVTYLWGESSAGSEIFCIVITTLILLVLGEVTPKTFARSNPLLLTRSLFPLISFIKTLLMPVLRVFSFFTGLFIKGRVYPEKSRLTQDDLSHMISSAVEKGVIKYEEERMIHAILSLKNKKAKDVMVGFDEMEMIAHCADNEKFLDELVEKEKSRIPVYQGEKKNIVGFVYLKDILQTLYTPPGNVCQKLLRPPVFAGEDDTLYSVFDIFKKGKVHIVLVRNNTEVVGLLTLEDILEEITGDILDEYDVEPGFVPETLL